MSDDDAAWLKRECDVCLDDWSSTQTRAAFERADEAYRIIPRLGVLDEQTATALMMTIDPHVDLRRVVDDELGEED
jgi:hypothetical protein